MEFLKNHYEKVVLGVVLLALEIGEDEGSAVKELLVRAGYRDVMIEKDLARHERLALGRRV